MAFLNYHHLRYFHAIARSGSLTQAAAQLNVSPSALSVQLRELEGQLGHELFERRGRRLVLTEAGSLVNERAAAIFEAGDELIGALKGISREKKLAIRIGALATLSRNFQMAFLAPLSGRDDVRFVLRSSSMRDLMQMLEAHHIDVLLTNSLPPRDDSTTWTAHLIADQPVSLIGPRAFRRSRGRTIEAVLSETPLIVPTPDNHIRGDFDAFLQRRGVSPNIVAEVDDMAMLRLLTRAGVGFAVAPPIVMRDELEAGALKEISSLGGLRERFYAIAPKRRFPNTLLRDLLASGADSWKRLGRSPGAGPGRSA
jgi:LysR family transcriptional activator of nhaA